MSISERMLDGLAGQTALVTGASAGLGRRFATLLAEAGVRVAVAARRRERLDELVAEIGRAGGTAIAVTLDLAAAHGFAAVIDDIESRLGPVSILVNNAGRYDGYAAIDLPPELIDDMLALNVRGPFVLACKVARRLIARKQPGRIVNMSAIGAFSFSAKAGALYSVTKAAMVRITETLAVEWAEHNINVNAIAPGFFHSEMSEGYLKQFGDAVVNALPRKRVGQPEQLDSTLLYLVSPASEMVTGTCIKVDDGWKPR